MGLENFTTSSSTGGNTRSTSRSTSTSHDDAHEAYKIIWNGKHTIPIEDNEVVIQTKEKWEKIATYINRSMSISNEQFNSKTKQRKYNIVSDAKKAIEDNSSELYSRDISCIVCGKEFTFPDDWDFVEFDNHTCCPHHNVENVMDEVGDQQRLR